MSVSLVFGSSAKANTVNQILSRGISTGNLSGAVATYGGTLPEADKSVLLSLTQTELAALQSINTKLAPLGISSLY